jgi:hypothetical protein
MPAQTCLVNTPSGKATSESCSKVAILNVAGGRTMTDEERERLAYLCERIQIERAPKTFDELVMELNELLEQKQRRIEPAQANTSTEN